MNLKNLVGSGHLYRLVVSVLIAFTIVLTFFGVFLILPLCQLILLKLNLLAPDTYRHTSPDVLATVYEVVIGLFFAVVGILALCIFTVMQWMAYSSNAQERISEQNFAREFIPAAKKPFSEEKPQKKSEPRDPGSK